MSDFKTSVTDQKVVPKGWGFELWIVNKPEYCGKLLHIDEGKRCSWHFHKLKDETFYIQSGVMEITYGYEPDRSDAQVATLGPGDSFYVPIGLIHQMRAIGGPLEFFEFSTEHFDEDSNRVERGD